MIDGQIEAGRIYHNPDGGEFADFEVVRTAIHGPLTEWSRLDLQIRNEALTAQLDQNKYGREEIDQIAGPNDPVQIEKGAKELNDARRPFVPVLDPVTGKFKPPNVVVFAHARLRDPDPDQRWEDSIVATGKATFADSRPSADKKARPEPQYSLNTMDLRRVHVRPTHGNTQKSLQNRGIGSAVATFMTQQLRDFVCIKFGDFKSEMPVTTRDVSRENPLFVPTLDHNYFYEVPERRDEVDFGPEKTPLFYYCGPSYSNFMYDMFQKRPWQQDWKPIMNTPEA